MATGRREWLVVIIIALLCSLICFTTVRLYPELKAKVANIAKLQAEIDILQTAAKANARYTDLLEAERDQLCKERDEAIRQRDVVVRTLSGVFNESSRRSSHRK